MRISTGKGDSGNTRLADGSHASKDEHRLETYGTVDELNAIIGIARAAHEEASFDSELESISAWLFDLGSDLATPQTGLEGGAKARLGPDRRKSLEEWIEREEEALPPLKNFILPGGTAQAAALHHARTVCRRAERLIVTLHTRTGEAQEALVFMNRLSDLLFLYARRANHDAGVDDIAWKG